MGFSDLDQELRHGLTGPNPGGIAPTRQTRQQEAASAARLKRLSREERAAKARLIDACAALLTRRRGRASGPLTSLRNWLSSE